MKLRTEKYHVTELIPNDSRTTALGHIEDIKESPVCSFTVDELMYALEKAKSTLEMSGAKRSDLIFHVWENLPGMITIQNQDDGHLVSTISYVIAPAKRHLALKRHDRSQLPYWLLLED